MITWKIEALDVKPQESSHTDVVVTAHWRCNGVDGDYSGSVYATCSFQTPEGSFTPFESLTEEQVLGWCWSNGVDKDATEAAVAQQIEDAKNPPIAVSYTHLTLPTTSRV